MKSPFANRHFSITGTTAAHFWWQNVSPTLFQNNFLGAALKFQQLYNPLEALQRVRLEKVPPMMPD